MTQTIFPRALVLALSIGLLPATTITFDDFSNPAGITLVGNAAVTTNLLRLTPAQERQVGAAWLNNRVNVANGFSTFFQFRITEQGGWVPDWEENVSNTGADGFTFVIQNSAPDAIGLFASGIGYYGIPNSLAIEFDTWNNIPEYCEGNGNHVAVQSLGLAENRPEHCAGNGFANPNLGKAAAPVDMSNGTVYDVRIDYTPGTLSVYLNDLLNPLLQVNVNLATLLSLQNATDAYIGFTSSTGGAFENHDIVKWNFTNVPEPMPMVLTGAGLLLLGCFRKRR